MTTSRLFAIAVLSLACGWGFTVASAQAPGSPAPPVTPPKVETTMLQLMRGIFYPASNVFFSAQTTDPTTIQKAHDPAIATDPLESSYNGWGAIENSALAMAEATNLLNLPGRRCSNGKTVPVEAADWQGWVERMRVAGQQAFKAAQSKNADTILVAADEVADACRACHLKYRDAPGGLKNRC